MFLAALLLAQPFELSPRDAEGWAEHCDPARWASSSAFVKTRSDQPRLSEVRIGLSCSR